MTRRIGDGGNVTALVTAAREIGNALRKHNVRLALVNIEAGNEPDQQIGVLNDDHEWTAVVTSHRDDGIAVTVPDKTQFKLDVLDVG
ncbi:hypothetical protein ACFWPU_00900 [Streptomyces sp. NPDC058471]|uniref:hypothetical protein n=1 Tax=Streptomyces sp. NPDC058471 TaxID=3346516 RepID=UPI00365458CC